MLREGDYAAEGPHKLDPNLKVTYKGKLRVAIQIKDIGSTVVLKRTRSYFRFLLLLFAFSNLLAFGSLGSLNA